MISVRLKCIAISFKRNQELATLLYAEKRYENSLILFKNLSIGYVEHNFGNTLKLCIHKYLQNKIVRKWCTFLYSVAKA